MGRLRLGSAQGADRPEVREALLDVAAAARAVGDGDRAAVLLLDTSGSVVPVVSAGRFSDRSVWTQVQPIPLADLSAVTAALDVLRGGPIAVDDVPACAWIPGELRDAYRLASVAIAALAVDRAVLGALVVYSTEPRTYGAGELATIGALATGAAVALRSALDADAAERGALARARLATASVGLQSAADSAAVLAATVAAVLDLTGSTSAQVLDAADDRLSGRASRAVRDVAGGDPRALLIPGGAPGTASVLVGPLGPERAVVVAEPAVADDATCAALAELAAQASAALTRVQGAAEIVRRVQHLEVLYQLADDLALAPDVHLVVERLAPAVRAAAHAELIDVFLCDPAASRLFGTHTARGTLARLMARWRRHPRADVATDSGLLVIPMLLDGTLVGVVRVRPLEPREPDAAERHLLQTIADGLAEAVARVVLRDRVATSERELAVADERERIARDLHDTLCQMHFAVRTELSQLAAGADDLLSHRLHALERMVAGADTELRQAIHALSFLGRGNNGLVPSVRALVRRVRDEHRLDVALRVEGTPCDLPPDQAEAMYRLAREALFNVARHARASMASVTVRFGDERVAVEVRDNGTGLLARPSEGLHFGLRSMQRRLTEVGGGLDVRNRSPHGVTVAGWVPAP